MEVNYKLGTEHRRSSLSKHWAPERKNGSRIEKNRLPWIIVRVALLAAGLWVYLGQFLIHR